MHLALARARTRHPFSHRIATYAQACPSPALSLWPEMAKKRRAKKRSPKQAPALTRQTWAKWIDFVKDHTKSEIFFVVWLTGALGLRCGEAIALRREDVGLDAEEPYVCAAGHTPGAKKSPGYIYVSRSNWRFLTRTLAKGIATTRRVGTKHGTRTRGEKYTPPAKGSLFKARTGTTKGHTNYMAGLPQDQ